MKNYEEKDFKKLLAQSVEKAQKYAKYLEDLTDPYAKDFFLTFYSGESKKGYEPSSMFVYFVSYIYNNFGFELS